MPVSKISWTDESLNFLSWNCNKVSPGCKFCYALRHSQEHPRNSANEQFEGVPRLREAAFDELRKTKPGTVLFVNTHSDTFHEGLEPEAIQRMFAVMNQRPDLIFLLLTKRIERAQQMADQLRWTDNIWLGTSVESQAYYLRRVPVLLTVPARHRFISFEPLLEAVHPAEGIAVEWAIVGGESGEMHRPFNKFWAETLQKWCARNQIPFFFKQGAHAFPDHDRLLNGRTYSERPTVFDQLHTQYRVDVSQGTLF